MQQLLQEHRAFAAYPAEPLPVNVYHYHKINLGDMVTKYINKDHKGIPPGCASFPA